MDKNIKIKKLERQNVKYINLAVVKWFLYVFNYIEHKELQKLS